MYTKHLNNSYELQEYYDLLNDSFDYPVEVDLARNKLGQDSVRVRYVVNKLKEFDMFIFGSDFAVAYKPNGKVKLYDRITPKQARAIVVQVLRHIKR